VSASAFERTIVPATRDLGDGFEVRRALPSAACRTVGPFVFFDQFGPTVFRPGKGLDVRPHPHIGLATVTYLFDGEIVHRDSLGSAQTIRPGEVNWMIAGSGIVHSERTAGGARSEASTLAGIQSWVALPVQEEQRPASFVHHGEHDLPLLENSGRRVRIIAGTLLGERAGVATLSPMGYADAQLDAGAELEFGDEFEQAAIYVVAGSVEAGGERFGPAQLLLPRSRERVRLRAQQTARVMLMAGAPLDGPRYLWWNFVASSKERIEQAKHDWREGRFGEVPGDAAEFIPLPPEPTAQDSPAPAQGTPL
jgi:redox-sensitive bicupin YhaK (pirin superfamily)